jgi:hypothetical protein
MPGAGTYLTDIQLDNFLAKDISSPDSIELTDYNFDYQVIQRDSSSSASGLFIRGTYEGSPTGIEAQIINSSDSSVVKDWTPLSSPTIANGFYTGTLQAVANGGWYKINVRFSNNTSVYSNGLKNFGIGIIIGITGQSNASNYFDVVGGTASPLLRGFDNTGVISVTGNGASSLGNKLISELGIPVLLLRNAVSGTALLAAGGWLDTGTSSLANKYYQAILAIGGRIECTFWSQGETEAKVTPTVSTADYYTGLSTLFGRFRTYANDAAHPIHIQPLGVDTEAGLDNVKWENIRLAQIQALSDPNNYFACCGWDLPMNGVHYQTASYATIANRLALAILRRLGVKSYGYGPRISSGLKVSDTIYDIILTHDGGTDFTPTTGITGFSVFDGTTPVSVLSAVRIAANTIRLTLASAVTTPTVYYMYGYLPAVSGGVHDNTPDALPLCPSGVIQILVKHSSKGHHAPAMIGRSTQMPQSFATIQ